MVCRFRGDEFTAILPDFPGKEHQPQCKVTISIGVDSSTKAKAVEELFIMVDKALYDAKSQNRNVVVIA